MESKLTTRSQEAIAAAQRLAVARGQAALEPLHLLAALLEQDDGIAAPLLKADFTYDSPHLPVIVRSHDDTDLDKLRAAGAAEVVPEAIEGSLMLASHALLMLGVVVVVWAAAHRVAHHRLHPLPDLLRRRRGLPRREPPTSPARAGRWGWPPRPRPRSSPPPAPTSRRTGAPARPPGAG